MKSSNHGARIISQMRSSVCPSGRMKVMGALVTLLLRFSMTEAR